MIIKCMFFLYYGFSTSYALFLQVVSDIWYGGQLKDKYNIGQYI